MANRCYPDIGTLNTRAPGLAGGSTPWRARPGSRWPTWDARPARPTSADWGRSGRRERRGSGLGDESARLDYTESAS